MIKKTITLFFTLILLTTLIIPVGLTQTETIMLGSPTLEFGRIEGGLMGFAVEFNNTGDANLTNLTWKTTMTGGLILFNQEANGTIDNITYNSSAVATVVPIIGLGRTEIQIRADADDVAPITTTKQARVILIFIIIDE